MYGPVSENTSESEFISSQRVFFVWQVPCLTIDFCEVLTLKTAPTAINAASYYLITAARTKLQADWPIPMQIINSTISRSSVQSEVRRKFERRRIRVRGIILAGQVARGSLISHWQKTNMQSLNRHGTLFRSSRFVKAPIRIQFPVSVHMAVSFIT